MVNTPIKIRIKTTIQTNCSIREGTGKKSFTAYNANQMMATRMTIPSRSHRILIARAIMAASLRLAP
jgi:hypothetical protein